MSRAPIASVTRMATQPPRAAEMAVDAASDSTIEMFVEVKGILRGPSSNKTDALNTRFVHVIRESIK